MSTDYFLSGSNDSDINLWNKEQTTYVTKYSQHSTDVLSLDVFRMDGNVFVSGSSDFSCRVWDVRIKNAAFRLFDKNPCGISCVRFMPENVNTIAVGQEDATVSIWDLRALSPICKFEEDTTYSSVSSMTFSKSGRFLFTSHSDSVIKTWDLTNEKKICSFGHDC